MSATPRPWFVEAKFTSGPRLVHGEANEDGFRDDLAIGRGGHTHEARANLDLICRAVNAYDAHEAVVKAARELLDDIRQRFPGDFVKGGRGFICEYHQAIDAALAALPTATEPEAS